MEQPQELEVWYVLPTIRKALATELKTLGLSQKDIAKKLDITPAAVSYYIKSKRANKMVIEIDDDIKKSINISAKKIIDETSTVLTEIQKNLRLFRDSKKLCMLHKKMTKVQCDCTICCNNQEG